MNVDKAQESYTYDVALDDKHYSVILQTDFNIGFTNVTVFDENGIELEEGTETFEELIAEVNSYMESQNSNYRRVNKMNINWQIVLKSAEAILRVIRKIMIGR